MGHASVGGYSLSSAFWINYHKESASNECLCRKTYSLPEESATVLNTIDVKGALERVAASPEVSRN